MISINRRRRYVTVRLLGRLLSILKSYIFYLSFCMVSHVREEHILRVFEDGVLRGISGPKRDEVLGYWRKMRNEELYNFTVH